jgi:CubicO group peptidase (beta-lactamase class C family)
MQAPYRKPGISQGYHALTFGWLVGELIRRVDGRTVGAYFKEEIADPLNIDFHIGLAESEFERCADMLMLSRENIKLPGEFLKYVPNFLLPQKLKNFKAALIKWRFQRSLSRKRMKIMIIMSILMIGEWQKFLLQTDTVLPKV